MDIAIRNQANANFRAVRISGYTGKVRQQALGALKEEGKIADISIIPHKPGYTDPTFSKNIFIKDLKQEGRFPLEIIMKSNYWGKYAGTIANIQKVVKEFIKGDLSGGLYIPDKGAFPEEIDKAIPKLEKLVSENSVNIFVLPWKCEEFGTTEHGYKIFVDKPNCKYTLEKHSRPIFTRFSCVNAISSCARVEPVDFCYNYPYHGLIAQDCLEYSRHAGDFNNWSDLIVDVAKFYVNNLKENKPNLHHEYVRYGSM